MDMPRIKLDYVVSFSSEDPDNQANNLLAWEVSKKKWLCSKGEPSCSIVLQLARAVKIGAVHVGCHLAATVEVLVGRSETPAEQFQVLVPRSVVLSPSESRRGEGTAAGAGTERVRSFTGEQLADARHQRWDRVRIVCTQPYNKHCKYGLSFVHIYEPEDPRAPASAPEPLPTPTPLQTTSSLSSSAPSAVPLRLTNFETFSSDEEEFRPGEIFAKLQQKSSSDPAPTTGSTSTESQIKQASSQALKNISESSTKLVKTSINKTQYKREATREDVHTNRQRDNLMYTDDDHQPHAKIDLIVQRHKDDKSRDVDNTTRKDKMDISKLSQRRDDQDGSVSRKRERERDSNGNKHGKDDRRTNSMTPRHSDKRDSSTNSSQKYREEKSRRSHPHKRDDRNEEKEVKEVKAGPVSSNLGSILAGAVLVLSGYIHPERGQARQCAEVLGARVQRDWGPGCTHLICAFPNTPKLKAVRAAGGRRVPVVCARWLHRCRAARRLLPWQWFATEPHYRLDPPPGAGGAEGRGGEPDSECDTDDEIQKVLLKNKKPRLHSPTPSPPAAASSGDVTAGDDVDDALSLSVDSDVAFVRDERVQASLTVSDSDSDVTEPEGPRGSTAELMDLDAALPDFFEGYTFVIESDVSSAQFDRELLARYVRAYGGLVLESTSMAADADYVVSVGKKEKGDKTRCVSPAWLWRCHHTATLCPHTPDD